MTTAATSASSNTTTRTRTPNANTLKRAIAHFTELGLAAPQAVMTDNALVYTNSRRFRELCTRSAPHTSGVGLLKTPERLAFGAATA
jgi:hypothetical protein